METIFNTLDELNGHCFAERSALLNYVDCAGQRIIDIGCGDGRFTLRHFAEAATILGVDSKQEEIDSAIASLETSQVRNPINTHFRCADIAEYPLSADSFDIAIFLRSF